jgi:drug/metabolite transporter (DMT)-like permease
VKRQDLAALVLLSSIWGGSFLFMRVAAPVLGPALLIEIRVLLAGLVLLAGTAIARTLPPLRPYWRPLLVVGLTNSAIPFLLIATAELHLTASLAATLNATTPLCGAVIAALWFRERLPWSKVLGLVTGLAGVAVLVGLGPLPLNRDLLVSSGESLVAAVLYGFSAVYSRAKLQGASPMAITIYSQLAAAIALLPLMPASMPHQAPSALVIGCTLALSLLSTALGYLLYFRLIARVGAMRATMVTYLSPAFGLLWGAVFLGERLGLGSMLGFGLILASVGLVSGLRLPHRSAEAIQSAS